MAKFKIKKMGWGYICDIEEKGSLYPRFYDLTRLGVIEQATKFYYLQVKNDILCKKIHVM